ncbi:6-phosphofructokinase [Desulfobacterota bacterium AH_259_B03_O07]|nr:6-phosphofructokinase [Desulfobacterota bacterium AH_259_B03_O07]
MSISISKKGSRDVLAILAGGGPAPGINGVISAATIEAINRGIQVIGIQDGFKWIANGDKKHIRRLTISDTSRIHLTGGSIIGISREDPTSTVQRMKNTLRVLKDLRVRYLVTIGGDGTLFLASRVEKESKGKINVAHIPKTIDNNLPLPGYIPTFGFETARHVGTELVQHLMEDAKTTSRWYFVVTMGRKTGHLALGIGKASGATLTIIPEEFGEEKISLNKIVVTLEGAIIKRLSMGREDGVAIISEGITEKLDESELENLRDLERDEHGRIMLSEVDLGQVLKIQARSRLLEKKIKIRIVDKRIGYELRSARPTPFDSKYARDLGYSAVKFLFGGGSGAMITIQTGKMVPMYFNKLLNAKTGGTRIRYVDTNTESYEVAEKYMIKLTKDDFENKVKLKKLSQTANMKPKEFVDYFSKALRS